MKRLLIPSIVGLAMLCAVCGAGVGAFWLLSNPSGGPTIHNLPIYPGATNVSVQDTNSSASGSSVAFFGSSSTSSSYSQSSGGIHIQSTAALPGFAFSVGEDGYITFSTNDSPPQVIAFYDASLTRAGWTLASSGGLFSSQPASVVASPSASQLYTYRSGLPWIPLVHRPDALMSLSVTSLGTGNDVMIFVMHTP